MEIFGKTLKEYFWPIKYYVIIAILVVISQYYIALPLSGQYPFILNITQGLWALAVIASVFTLVKKYDFGVKNIIFLGVLYSIIIHGLKSFFFRVFLFPYTHLPAEQIPAHLMGKFLYGSAIVMAVVVILGPLLIYLEKKKLI
ncbi:MAG: hypothetical protein ISS48_00475 [Candidatus Aenigmarchaeota archaeon]|nr:hypothetical protein [Candidatus Aenigmarchaeota archaeon]